jgi:1-aminocyclopropane-1-carboxylate deaminase/D-cysteine desulfhydrase-like pyridoxal-dependent ACC family enzyme
VKLDPIYTAKLLLGIYDMAEARLLHERARHHLPSLVDTDARDEAVVNVLAVHTGGLQGLKGVEEKIGEKIF